MTTVQPTSHGPSTHAWTVLHGTNTWSHTLPQKSTALPFLSQSPYLVGSGPLGPSISPVSGFVSLGNRAYRLGFWVPSSAFVSSVWGCATWDFVSHCSSSFPTGVVAFFSGAPFAASLLYNRVVEHAGSCRNTRSAMLPPGTHNRQVLDWV